MKILAALVIFVVASIICMILGALLGRSSRAQVKFFATLLIGIVMLATIALGLVAAVGGVPWMTGPWLLILSAIGFIVAVGKIGCAVH
jgi:hypothetical protein